MCLKVLETADTRFILHFLRIINFVCRISVKDNGFNHTYCILAIVMVVIFFVLVLSIQGAKKLFCKSTEPSEKVKITKKSPPSPMKN